MNKASIKRKLKSYNAKNVVALLLKHAHALYILVEDGIMGRQTELNKTMANLNN
jgi:hypothetical protein